MSQCVHPACTCDTQPEEEFCCGACKAAYQDGNTEDCVCPHDGCSGR